MRRKARFQGQFGPVLIDPVEMPVGEIAQLERGTLIVFSNGTKQIVDENITVVELRLQECLN